MISLTLALTIFDNMILETSGGSKSGVYVCQQVEYRRYSESHARDSLAAGPETAAGATPEALVQQMEAWEQVSLPVSVVPAWARPLTPLLHAAVPCKPSVSDTLQVGFTRAPSW